MKKYNYSTVSELERNAGVKTNAIRNILNGTSKNPGIHTLKSLAKTLRCSVSELIDDSADIGSSIALKEESVVNVHLYKSVINCVLSLCDELDFKVTFPQTSFLTHEVYQYSAKEEMDEVDHRFARWFVEKYVEEIISTG